MSGDFSPEQKRYLEGFVSRPQIARGRATGWPAASAAAAGARRPRRRSICARRTARVAAGGKLADQEKFKREQHPFDAYARLKEQAAANELPEARRQFPLALLRAVLCRAGAELLHVPAAHPERHPEALAVRGPRRSRRALRRRLCACHHARQPADPRDRAEERGRAGRGDPGSRPVLARLRRRQHPQRHRHADRRHRPAGADRHAALCARMALPHPQRARALRPAAQVQRRLRRRRHHPGAGGHQRHRLPGGRGERRLRRRARRLVPPRARRHHRPPAISRATPA